MYGMNGILVAQPNQRDKLVAVLIEAAALAGQMPGCDLYAVAVDLSNEVTIQVTELWESKEAHDESLKEEKVRALIADVMTLIGGPPQGAEMHVIDGHGLSFLPVVEPIYSSNKGVSTKPKCVLPSSPI